MRHLRQLRRHALENVDPTKPLGAIPTPELRNARGHIHRLIDPLWKHGRIERRFLYQRLAEALGVREFHTAELRTIEDARDAYREALKIAKGL